jgi:DNA-binding GntR family transcriptional regulator
MADTDPIERKSIVESVADRLRVRILDNELAEGDTLRQEAIAAKYAVSRIPVREALRQLEAEGLVVFHRHRGAVVSRLNVNEVGELFDLRILIERDLIRRAVPRADEADLDNCLTHLEASEEAFRSGGVRQWGELNWKFHEALYRPAGRDRSLNLAQMLNLNTDRYVRIQLSLEHAALERAMSDHRRLYKLYSDRDAEGAVAMLDEHLAKARDALVHAFKS